MMTPGIAPITNAKRFLPALARILNIFMAVLYHLIRVAGIIAFMLNPIAVALSKYEKEKDFIDLIDTNFTRNGFVFPPGILERESIKYFKNRNYQPDPKGLLTARQAISEYYSRNSTDIGPENILITASTSESYNLIFNTFTKPGDEVLLPRPGYPLFEYLAKFNRLGVRYYDLAQIESKGEPKWQIDLESVKAGLNSRTKFIVVISPNNPTGAVFSKEELVAAAKAGSSTVAEAGKGAGAMVISDEVFSEFLYDGHTLPRIANVKDGPIVFTLNGISKTFALPDLKLGWIGVSGTKLVEKEVDKVVDRLETANDVFLNANYLSQSLLPVLFEEGAVFTGEMVAKIKQNRDLVAEKLVEANTKAGKALFRFAVPEGGIHMWINIRGEKKAEEEFVLGLIEKQHVSVHPGYFYDCPAEKGVNIVVSLLPEKEKKLIEGFSRIISAILSDPLRHQ